jgi:hypothetical protein
MTELETQVAKINIANLRQANTYVFVMAEKVDATESELYAVCELPMLNPAAAADCQRICEAIAAAMRRGYRSLVNENTFENTLAHINDELGKLAGLGKTHWIGKLNAIVAVKTGATLYLSSTGKMTALLLRDNKFNTIVESEPPRHPLKTFENLSVGTLRLDDILIFSTNQLFNHISIDRVQNILGDALLGEAATEIIEILRDNAGPEVAFGAIFALQIEPGQEAEGEVDLAQYITRPLVEDDEPRAQITVGEMEERYIAGENKTTLDKIKSLGNKMKHYSVRSLNSIRQYGKTLPRPSVDGVRAAVTRTKPNMGLMTERFQRARSTLKPETFRRFSWQKKFFFVCAIIFLIALVVNIVLTQRHKSATTSVQTFQSQLSEMQKLADDANASFLYNDLDKARFLTSQLADKLDQFKDDKTHQSDLSDVKKQLSELQIKLDKRTTVSPTSVAALSQSDNLIILPSTLGTETNRTIVSYNRSTGKVQDNFLKSSESVVSSSAIKDTLATVYNGSELFAWDPSTGILSSPFGTSVPGRDSFGGMRAYPVNNKVYVINKSAKKITNFAVAPQGITSPAISVENDQLANATGLAIDGNIYVALSNGSILKFQSGKQLDFNLSLTSPLSSHIKIYTQNDFTYLYVMDQDNKQILAIYKTGDKAGSVAAAYISDQFTNLKDFVVDEKNKIVFVLNGTSLLKFSISF